MGLTVLSVLCVGIAVSAICDGGFHSILVDHFAHASVEGSGKIVEDHRSLENVRKVVLEDGLNATISVGATPSVTILADDNVAPLITTEVDDGTLTIAREHRFHGSVSPKIAIVVPRLEVLDMTAGTVSIAGLDGGPFRLQLQGAGDVTASGRVDSAKLEIDGSGRLRFGALEAADLDLEVKGSGKAEIRATESLTVEIKGSGDVVYSGSPKHVEREIHGAGTIREAI